MLPPINGIICFQYLFILFRTVFISAHLWSRQDTTNHCRPDARLSTAYVAWGQSLSQNFNSFGFYEFCLNLCGYSKLPSPKKKGCSQCQWKILSFQGSPGFWSRSHYQNRWSIRNHTNTLNEWCNDCLYNDFVLFTYTHSSLWHFDRLLCSGFEFYWCFWGQNSQELVPSSKHAWHSQSILGIWCSWDMHKSVLDFGVVPSLCIIHFFR